MNGAAINEVTKTLLVEMSCIEMSAAAISRVKEVDLASVDWNELVRQAAYHGIAGMINLHLSRTGLGELFPSSFQQRVREIAIISAMNGTRHATDFVRLQKALSKRDVRVLVLKGVAFSGMLYGNQGLRSVSDVDVLIRESDWTAAREVLEQEGYTAYTKDFIEQPSKLTKYDVRAHLQYSNAAGTVIEFQFDLLTLGIGMRGIDLVWDRAVEIEIEGEHAWTPSPEDNLIHACVHANRHGFSRLKWLVDIAELLRMYPNLDWKYMSWASQREGVKCCLYFGLETVSRLIPELTLKKEAMNGIKPGFLRSWVWHKVWPDEDLKKFHGRENDVIVFAWYNPIRPWNLINLILTDRIRDKISLQLRWLLPPMWWLAEEYGQPRSWALARYYLIRPLSAITGKYNKAADKAVSRKEH